MTAAPPGLALSGELRANAYHNIGQEEGSSRRGTPSVGSGGSRGNVDHRGSNRRDEVSIDANSELP
eukprot:5152330-Alexandrium_andersonii.AAC.1